MTFNDFAVEAQLYEYSDEHYQFMKECAELELMESVINSQLFYQNNANLIEESADSIPDEYFLEAVDNNGLETMIKNYNEKFSDFMRKAGNKLVDLWKIVRNFFVKIINKFDDQTKTISASKKKMEATINVLSDEQLVQMNAQLSALARKCNLNLSSEQPGIKELKLPANVVAKKQINFNLIAAAYSSTYVYVDSITRQTDGPNSPATATTVDFETLVELFNKAKAGKLDVMHAMDDLDKVCQSFVGKRFEINVNPAKLQKQIDKLDSYKKSLDDAYSQYQSNAGDSNTKGDGEDGKNSASTAKFLNEYYGKLKVIASNTMSLYTGVANYRAAVYKHIEKNIGLAQEEKETKEKVEKFANGSDSASNSNDETSESKSAKAGKKFKRAQK